MYPDFIFFHSVGQAIKTSIVDPHDLADALPKLRSLADFAVTHGDSFHRIGSVAQMEAGVLRSWT